MKKRYYFLDNLRWVTVLLVLLYHIFYNFNSVGVFGGIGGFSDHQWQDTVCAVLNPWFMTLLFMVAGASSRYALQSRTPKEFRRERTRKLLIPSTLGLFVFGWVLGMLNMRGAGAAIPDELPFLVKYLIAVPSGTGHLWFLQDLFLFSLLLLPLRKVVDAERIDRWLTGLPKWGVGLLMALYFLLLWGISQSQIDNPTAAQGLLNLYRPIYYFATFVAGYYLFSSERIHTFLTENLAPLAAVALLGGVGFCTEFYGADYTSAAAVQSLWCNIFCWGMTLAMLGGFKRYADHTTPFADYMSRSSFGIYVVHMTVCTAICLTLKGSGLPVWLIYTLALMVTFVGSFALWEILRHIPFVRYCVFGIERKSVQKSEVERGK